MVIDRRYASIVASIASAAAEPARWADACDRLAEALGAVSVAVFAWDAKTRSIPRTWASSAIVDGAAELLGALPDGPVPEAEARIMGAIGRSPREAFRTGAEFCGVETNADLPANPFYDALRARLPILCRAGAPLGDSGPVLDVFAAHFRYPDEALPRAVRAEAEALTPIVGRAVEANRVIEGLAGRAALLSAAFDRFDFGICFADGDGRLAMANRAAREMMAEGEGLREAAGRLATPTAPGALERPIAAAARGRLGGRDSIVALPRGLDRPLLARVFAVRAAPVSGAAACVLLVDPNAPQRLGTEGVAALGLLTAAENEVVSLLVGGAGTEEIAERRNTSPETTRGQIKSAAAKLNCPTRLDVVRLAMATRLFVHDEEGSDPPPGG